MYTTRELECFFQGTRHMINQIDGKPDCKSATLHLLKEHTTLELYLQRMKSKEIENVRS